MKMGDYTTSKPWKDSMNEAPWSPAYKKLEFGYKSSLFIFVNIHSSVEKIKLLRL